MGLGFADRTDAFDLNVALQDHFKSLRLEEQIQKESEVPMEKLDLSLKEGQTIKASFFNIVEKSIKALKIEYNSTRKNQQICNVVTPHICPKA